MQDVYKVSKNTIQEKSIKNIKNLLWYNFWYDYVTKNLIQ